MPIMFDAALAICICPYLDVVYGSARTSIEMYDDKKEEAPGFPGMRPVPTIVSPEPIPKPIIWGGWDTLPR